MRDTVPTPIATTTLFGQRPGGKRFPITVEIGKPYQSGTEEWACPVALRPFDKLPDVAGGDSLQALCLSIGLVREMLQSFKDDGGILTHESGEDFALDSYSLGVARNDYGGTTTGGGGRE